MKKKITVLFLILTELSRAISVQAMEALEEESLFYEVLGEEETEDLNVTENIQEFEEAEEVQEIPEVEEIEEIPEEPGENDNKEDTESSKEHRKNTKKKKKTKEEIKRLVLSKDKKQEEMEYTYGIRSSGTPYDNVYFIRIHYAGDYKILSCTVNGVETDFWLEENKLLIESAKLAEGKNSISLITRDGAGQTTSMQPWEFEMKRQT